MHVVQKIMHVVQRIMYVVQRIRHVVQRIRHVVQRITARCTEDSARCTEDYGTLYRGLSTWYRGLTLYRGLRYVVQRIFTSSLYWANTHTRCFILHTCLIQYISTFSFFPISKKIHTASLLHIQFMHLITVSAQNYS
jgi:hypothetical protein